MRDGSWVVTTLVGALCLFFAISGTMFPKGAGLFPMLMGSLGVVTALLCLYWQFTGTTGPREKKEHFDRAPLFAAAMTFVYPLLVFLLGYIVGTISFILTMIPARRGNLGVLLGFAVLVTGLWLVFSKFLFLRLPSGILWPLFL